MNDGKIKENDDNLHRLDAATQEIIRRLNKNDRRLLISGFFTLIILFGVGIFGIYRQNAIASDNKQHIDCIVKLLATPSKPGQTRRIVQLQDCHIKVGP